MALVIDIQDFDRMSPEDARAYADHLAKKLSELREKKPPVPVTWVAMRKEAQFYNPDDYSGTGTPPVRDESTLIEMGFHGESKEYKDFILKHGPRVSEAVVCKSVKSALLELSDTEDRPKYKKSLEANETGGEKLEDYFNTNKTLADYLREQYQGRGVNKTFLMGAVSSHCVSETAVSAALKGFNPQIFHDMVLSWGGDENKVNPQTSLLLWRGTGESDPDKWNSFHKGKIEEKIRNISSDSAREFSTDDVAAFRKIDFSTIHDTADTQVSKIPQIQRHAGHPMYN